jgi:hypothetical protein
MRQAAFNTMESGSYAQTFNASRKDTVKDGNERGGKRPLKKQPSSAALSLALTYRGSGRIVY